MPTSRKRLFTVFYEATGAPAYVDEAGGLFKLSGLVCQGMGSTLVVLLPSAAPLGDGKTDQLGQMVEGVWAPKGLTGDPAKLAIVRPTLEELAEIIRRSDDPLYFETDPSGVVKAIHRKSERAVSGTVGQKVWARDGFRCLYCGRPMGDVTLTIDHFIPIESGGGNDPSNLISVCRKCNKTKGNQSPEDYCRAQGLDFVGLETYLKGLGSVHFIAHLV